MITNPGPVKLFIGMLSKEISLFDELTRKLKSMYGIPDLESPVWPWEHSAYYTDEMGAELNRKFVFFKQLIEPGTISGIKLKTNELEQQYLNERGGRRINLDPGYLDSAKLVLVSAKDFSHRIYLDHGIYGEVTLIYAKNDYQPLLYTYSDYKSEEYLAVFRKARTLYKETTKNA
jgi:hypothetical protein